ncbi:RrF2 family transcriptional regulator [Marinilabilia rubra]|uniref:Rrf2 family transcriptional regulator n=1 Tax=Marinilabilia rubra TaxID=2162893 RepID=A0A2U2BB34_9BACT|nr:Rrf2 family transcriptional regulator [Marinilabilia rubra]PWE00284.1 Rrf2 family transcriptional regulator [Marinilabilia rubra]
MLSKSSEYAIRAMVSVQLQNWENKRPGVGDVAEHIEAPVAFTAKILQALTKSKLLHSAKGRGGGFFFSGEDEDVTLFQIIQCVEGEGIFHRCGFGMKSCSDDNPCPLHDQYLEVRGGYERIVKNSTIQSLAAKIRDGKAVLNSVMGH